MIMSSLNASDVLFRPGTVEDLDFIAWCNYTSTSPSPGFCYWDPTLEGNGTDTITFISKAISLDVLAWCRVSDFVIGTYGSVNVAGAARFRMRKEDYRPIDLAKAPLLYESLGWDAETVGRFEGIYFSVWSDPNDETLRPSGIWTVECVAVAEQARGKEVAKALLAHILKEACDTGIESVGISVTPGNDVAKRTYLAAGFQPFITYYSEYYYDQFPGIEKYRWRPH